MSAPRTAGFERRAVLYTRYDVQLCEYTRFFAAAATINAVLGMLFAVFPVVRSPLIFNFLDDVGAALETDNMAYARNIKQRAPCSALDHVLVCAEQARLQRHVHTQQVRCPQQWESTRRELNQLLNEHYAASLFLQWCESSARLFRVLRQARGSLGMELDFANESHRIWIGRELIDDIRRGSSARSGWPKPLSSFRPGNIWHFDSRSPRSCNRNFRSKMYPQ